MGGAGKSDACIQDFFHPTPHTSPLKQLCHQPSGSNFSVGEGFTSDEIQEALKPAPVQPWNPTTDYDEYDIGDLYPGRGAIRFTGRLANIYDIQDAKIPPRSAKGCFRICVKDDTGAISTTHIGAGGSGFMSNSNTPLSASLFPEGNRSCHLQVHQSCDENSMQSRMPLNYRDGHPVEGVMTMVDFLEGGYEVPDARFLVLVKSIGSRKRVMRKQHGLAWKISVKIHDHTGEAKLDLWGTAALSPFTTITHSETTPPTPDITEDQHAWRAGETVLLIQAPSYDPAKGPYLDLNASTIIDINPSIPDTHWLRNWHLRHKRKESINPPFPENTFDHVSTILSAPTRCLYTIADLDDAARNLPRGRNFQSFLSLLITDIKLLDSWKRCMLMSGDCLSCSNDVYANATSTKCQACGAGVSLRLNPRIIGQVVDKTAAITGGKLLLCDEAWTDLLGRGAPELLAMRHDALKALADRLLFCRVTVIFGWTADESKAGGRISVLGVRA